MAKTFIERSLWQRRLERFKLVSWLTIPAAVVVGLVEYNVRYTRITTNYARIDNDSNLVQTKAAQDLVAGCTEQEKYPILPDYLTERVFGSCQPLRGTDLSSADLISADLSNADLSSASLLYANLNDANLISTELLDAGLLEANLDEANLTEANLNDANLLNASLERANLSKAILDNTILNNASLLNANLNNASFSQVSLSEAEFKDAELKDTLFLATDLRTVKNLTQNQLTAEPKPLLCNSPLPKGIEIEGGMNRDCYQIAEKMFRIYPHLYETLENAQREVDEARAKTWE